jgi:negative regulator of sigma E activity
MNRASLPKDKLLQLMAYADGELEGEDLASVEKLVAENAEAKRFVESLGALGDHIRLVGDPEPKITLEGIAETVMARIEREERKANTQKRIVVDLAQVRAERAQMAGRTGGGAWKVGAFVAAALALAAGAVFMLRGEQPGAHNTPQVQPQSQSAHPQLPIQLPKENVLASIAAGVDVESLDAPEAVSVFYVPAVNAAANANASSVVVWIEDEVKQ